jgi:AraC-like DNA-binding protein
MFDFIEELSNDLNMSISDFCERKRIAPKTLYRHSKKYLCRTPSEFRKVLRFNAVLKDYIDFNVVQPVTNVDSFIHFFDQAHMIKDFKSLTGLTPKLFFEKLNSPSEELNWIFLKDR